MTSLRLALMALALGACTKQSVVRAPAAPTKTLDIYHLCDDSRFEQMCTPVQAESPMQVDTNLESPRPRSAHHPV
ncbi:MAG: hypothetical protein SFX73_31150 [Kofleriaceae bacterium]|nr:hypothetical protein [Kofleriaceae bacterium]